MTPEDRAAEVATWRTAMEATLTAEQLTQIQNRRTVAQRAMESGRLDELPSMVQGRGMLSNYATFLNLDNENILLRYAEGLQQRRLERIPPPQTGLFSGQRQARGARQASPLRRLLTPDLIFGGSLILILFGFVIWTAARISSIRSGEAQSTLSSVGAVLLLTPSATLDLAALTQSPDAGTPLAGEGEVTAPTQSLLLTNATDTGVPVSTLATASTLAPINNDPLQVYIIARQRTFLRVLTDGEIKFNGRVVPGNAYPFSGQESIEFITGNAAAFQVFFNQTDLGSLGRSGEVLRMTFTQNGVVTPTPLPTSTPAPTIVITATTGPSPTVATPTVTPLIP
jgi:cytoskeletal protein RodZ